MMKKFLLISAFVFGLPSSAQSTHTVIKGDTPYNISKKYGLSIAQLYQLNPSVTEGKIRIGDVLSVSKGSTSSSASTNNRVGSIVLQPKQTIYGITKQYHISEQELRKLNPELDSHMRIGDRVTLPLDLIEKYADPSAQIATSEAQEANIDSTTEQLEYYEVKAKDNYYRITRRYNLTQEELFAMNPGLEEKGLQPGAQIIVRGNINTSDSQVENETSQSEQGETSTTTVSTESNKDSDQDLVQSGDYLTYTVRSGDTVFGILNRFKITLDQLLELNPSLSSGLKTGMVLNIKKLDSQYIKKSGDELNVVLMLPFGFDSSDSRYRSMATDFLMGAKLAIERQAKGGQKLNINVVDAGNEQSFKNSLTQLNRDNTDLIVGPFFKSSVLDVLDYVKSEKIPVVAPFANSDDLYDHSNLIIVETRDETYADRIVEEVKDKYNNEPIFILGGGDKTFANRIREGLEKELKNPQIKIVTSATDIVPATNMMTGSPSPLIAILASNNDGLGASFGRRMIEISKDVQGVKAYSMYYNSIFENQIDALSQVSLVYLMDRKINTEGSFEKEVLKAYEDKYCKAPSKYAVIGFDVLSDILSRENNRGEVWRQIGKSQTQLATKFEYVPAQKGGAYINTGYRVVRLIP